MKVNLKSLASEEKDFFFLFFLAYYRFDPEILSNDNFPNTTKPVQLCRLVEEARRIESLEKKVIFYN